ncbi:MAG: hypothetical protein ACXW1Z_19845 [Methylobacter sp.]
MQINIVNITNEEIDYLLAKIGVKRHNGALICKGHWAGAIEPIYLEIDFEKLKKLEAVKL